MIAAQPAVSDRRNHARYEPLLTIEQVAEWLNVPVHTLRTWRKKGIGPVGLLVGKSLRYERTSVEKFLDAARNRRSCS